MELQTPMRKTGQLTDRFQDALGFAFQLHRRQVRKGSLVPYVSHLLAVAAIVLENGGDEDTAIAALLHDAVEDQGGLDTLSEIRLRFSERVAQLIAACSDTVSQPKPPWKERKKTYLCHLAHVDDDVLLISLADKLHNAKAIVADYHRVGELIWERFHGGKEGTLWYYRSFRDIVAQRDCHPELVRQLREAINQMEHLAEGVFVTTGNDSSRSRNKIRSVQKIKDKKLSPGTVKVKS